MITTLDRQRRTLALTVIAQLPQATPYQEVVRQLRVLSQDTIPRDNLHEAIECALVMRPDLAPRVGKRKNDPAQRRDQVLR